MSTARVLVDASGRPTGEISRRRPRCRGRIHLRRILSSGELGASSTPVVRRAALRGRRDPVATDSYAADTDMALRFSLTHRMGYLDRPLYRYRRHGKNASTSLLESVRLNVPILERLLESGRARARRPRGAREARAREDARNAGGARDGGGGRRAAPADVLPLLRRAARLHPSPKHLRRLALVSLFGPRAYGAWRRVRAR